MIPALALLLPLHEKNLEVKERAGVLVEPSISKNPTDRSRGIQSAKRRLPEFRRDGRV